MSDESPASTSEPKNSTPNRSLSAGSVLTTSGKTTKARPMPSVATSSIAMPCDVAMNPSAPNTPMPAKSSNEELPKPAISAEFVRSAFRGRYEA